MKSKTLLNTLIAVSLTALVSLLTPIPATASSHSKTTAKPKAPVISACFKANLARTALSQTLKDADNVLSITSALNSSLPDIQSPLLALAILPAGAPQTPRGNLLSQNTTSYSKIMTYISTLESANSILEYSAEKALKNVAAGKVSSTDKFDASTAFKVFVGTLVNLPTDDAGITITNRNLMDNTKTLLSTTERAFSRSYPANASNVYASASKSVGQNMANNDVPLTAMYFQGEIAYVLSGFSSWNDPHFDEYWQRLIAQTGYIAIESQITSTLVQKLKSSTQAALGKLPKC